MGAFEKDGNKTDLQCIEEGVAFFDARITPGVAGDLVVFLERAELEGKKHISCQTADGHDGQEAEIAHGDLGDQLFLVPVFQKQIAHEEGNQGKEDVQGKRVIGQQGIGKPAEIIFCRLQCGFRHGFPAHIAVDCEHKQKV